MTRLKSDDITHVAQTLSDYEKELVALTGRGLMGLACYGAGVEEAVMRPILAQLRIGVVPITCGQGIISGFSRAVAAIAGHLGCRAFVTKATDAGGLANAFERKTDLLLLSDDARYVAINVADRRVVDNGAATGAGFAAGLDLMAGGLKGKVALVIGCGPVGASAARALAHKGAIVSVYDIDPVCSRKAALKIGKDSNRKVLVAQELEGALRKHRHILEASPAAGIIDARHISADTYISAPGVPVGLTPEARFKIGSRLLHDPLQIGTAMMIIQAAMPQGDCRT